MSNLYINAKNKHPKIVFFMFFFCFLSFILLIYEAPLASMSNAEFSDTNTTQNYTFSNLSESDLTHFSSRTELVSDTPDIPAVPHVQALTGTSQTVSRLTLEDVDISFFEHSVFVGDSISVGFESYCRTHADSIMTDTTYFLARSSCSAKVLISDNALTTHKNVVPLYNDTPQYVEDSIAQIESVEKVFLCFGVNDLVVSSPEEYINNIHTLISRILAKNPGVAIYTISVPCVDASVTVGNLNNDTIMSANMLLQEACQENNWGFINLTEYLMNESGDICQEYSSDGYVHENSLAYDVWTKILKNYAHEGKTT